MGHSVSESRPLAITWMLLVILIVGIAFIRGPEFDSSFLNLLPETERDPLKQQAGDAIGQEFSSRIILLVSGGDEAKTSAATASMANGLAKSSGIAEVTWHVEEIQISRLRNELFPHRFNVIDPGIRQTLLAGGHDDLTSEALSGIFGPVSVGDVSLIDDPFGIYTRLMENRGGDLNIEISNSMLKVRGTDQPTYMMLLTLAGSPFNPVVQQAVLGAIETQRRIQADNIEGLLMSGMLLHAAAGAQQAKREISTIGIGSLLGIVIAILLIFRGVIPLLLILLSISIGCVFAAAVTLLVFGKIHLLTLAFGTGLVGVSIDYALHFICQRRYSPPTGVLEKILTGLSLGLFSSVLAYAVMLLTPFPGLRQMATFSVTGLIASWLTVVLWFPRLTRGVQQNPVGFTRKLERLRSRFPRIDAKPRGLLMIAIPLLPAMAIVWNSEGQDDVRLLQTSPASLLEQEQEVHAALGSANTSQFLLIEAPDLELCLQREEALHPQLDDLKEKSVIGDYLALSDTLPSRKRQAQNSALLSGLYQSQLAGLFDVLGLPDARLTQAQQAFEAAADTRLTPDAWHELDSSRLRAGYIVKQDAATVATVIRFKGVPGATATAELEKLADSVEGVFFVDRVQNYSNLMQKFRDQIKNWIIIAYLIVLVALLFRYRRQVWRIVLPPLLASVFTLAILVQLEQGVNLFHLLALILVLGIGLDMGIFLQETDEAAHTWLAVSLSVYTSLLAFGLLALSVTPVLHHFGITVAIGLSLLWLMAPFVRRRDTGNVL